MPRRQASAVACAANVATVCGAAVTPTDDVLRPLARLTPILWPDGDDAGRAHMTKIAARFVALGVTPSIITWPDAPEKGDAADLVEQGGTADAVRSLIETAGLAEALGRRLKRTRPASSTLLSSSCDGTSS